MNFTRVSAAIMTVLLTAAITFADVPSQISYQGTLTDSTGNPITGTRSMLFKLYSDSTGGDYPLWSETQSSVEIANGLFSVQLGSVNPLSPTIFNGSTRWLAIQIDPDTEDLTPRQPMITVPYGFRSADADHAVYADTANYSMVGTPDDDWQISGNNIYRETGNVGIGTSAPVAGLEVASGDSIQVKLGGAFNIGTNLQGYKLYISDYDNDDTNDTYPIYCIDENGQVDFWLRSRFHTGPMTAYFGGNVGIETTDPQAKLHVEGEVYASAGVAYDGAIRGVNTINGWGVKGVNSTTENYGYLGGGTFSVYGRNNSGCYGGFGTTFHGAVAYHSSGNFGRIGTDSLGVYGVTHDSRGAGVMGRYTWDGAYGMLGTSNYGVYGTNNNSIGALGTSSYGVYGLTGNPSSYAGYFLALAPGASGIFAWGSTDGYAAEFRGNVAIKGVSSGDLVVELGEGLDYAEGFNVSDETEIEPGTVLIIDPDNPGELAISHKPYDSKVAGIVAGAKGMGSGVRLGPDQFDYDVALAGRVFCNVETINSDIQPGDLLTTSSIPGYAMKAADHSRTHGTILGKAMEPLEKGQKGQILVLITLQ
jgi:hypothetical protein